MSVSNRSRVSNVYDLQSAKTHARNAAIREIRNQVEKGQISRHDEQRIKDEYTRLYYYYEGYYASTMQATKSVIYIPLPVDNPKKFPVPHTLVRFSRSNLFIHVRRTQGCLTVGRYNYPIDEEETLETREAALLEWPGPLDRADYNIRKKIKSYIDTLWLRERNRKIKYVRESSDLQRKRILEILQQLLVGNGVTDSKSITLLLLKKELVEIGPYDQDLEKLKKYLLIGQRKEASKCAKSIKLWNHATCLCLLDEFQPPSTCDRLNILQHLDDLIDSVDEGILNTVYRGLFNRIPQRIFKSSNFVKHPYVGIDDYKFAILSANDCEMEYDQSREDFKLIIAAKMASSAPSMSNIQMITLGLRHIVVKTDSDIERRDEDYPSYQSNASFEQQETHESRTSLISNIDMLILNEIWEYCCNLARGTCDRGSYEYFLNLIPYKLVFASKLLDFGLHEMFVRYMNSIGEALEKEKERCRVVVQNPFVEADTFYDWDTIETSYQLMKEVACFCVQDVPLPQESKSSPDSVSYNSPPPNTTNTFQTGQPTSQSHYQYQHSNPLTTQQTYANNEVPQNDFPDSSHDLPSMPYQGDGSYHWSNRNQVPPPSPPPPAPSQQHTSQPLIHHQQKQLHPQQHVPSPHQPAPHQPQQRQPPAPLPYQHSSHQQNQSQSQQLHQQQQQQLQQQTSRRTSYEIPPPPPSFYQPTIAEDLVMTSSSPLNQPRDSMTGNTMLDSFQAFSPINEYDDLPKPSLDNAANGNNIPQGFASGTPNDNDLSSRGAASNLNKNAEQVKPLSGATSNSGAAAGGSGSAGGSGGAGSGGDPQQPGFLANLVGSAKALLPKSNSKQMILPDDSDNKIVYDKERNMWVDKSKPDGGENDELIGPPPMMANSFKPPSSYSAPKSTRARYPKAPF